MEISIIAAVGQHNEIGRDNDLLWHLPADMKFFKETTRLHHVIMGRKNYESIPPRFRPFTERTNIVISRNANYDARGCIVSTNLPDALNVARENGETEAFIIGGEQIYRLALELGVVTRMYITRVAAEFPGAHAHFPPVELTSWKRTLLMDHPADERHPYSFQVFLYDP